MTTKKPIKKQNKGSRVLSWLKPTSPIKGLVLFAVVFAVAGGVFFGLKSFAATPGGISASSVSGKDAYGCPLDYSKRPTLRYGNSGGCVYQLQMGLNYVNQPISVTVDGKFGPQTLNSVKFFQTREGLTVDGVVGPVSWARLATYGH